MRNQYPGVCYRCGSMVAPKEGHFERHGGRWRTIHAGCVFMQRQEKARARAALQETGQ